MCLFVTDVWFCWKDTFLKSVLLFPDTFYSSYIPPLSFSSLPFQNILVHQLKLASPSLSIFIIMFLNSFFSHQHMLVDFSKVWDIAVRPNPKKSLGVVWVFRGYINKSIVWIFFILSFLSPFIALHLENVPRAASEMGIGILFIFHSFFSTLTKSNYLYIFSASSIFSLLSRNCNIM